MIIAALAAAGTLVGVPWIVVFVIVGGAVAPVPVSVALAVLLVMGGLSGRISRKDGAGDEVRYLAGVAAELRAGASLRAAIVAASSRAPRLELGPAVRLADAGAPMHDVAEAVAPCLRETGELVGPAVDLAAASGGRSAVMFDRLALLAMDADRLAQEIAVSSSQAIASAWVVGLLPVPVLVLGAASGGLGQVAAAGPVGAAVVIGGVALLVVGSAVVVAMVRRAAR